MSLWLDELDCSKVSEVLNEKEGVEDYDSVNSINDECGELNSCHAAVWELKRLEEKLFMWKEVRWNTIVQLRSIADYMDSMGQQTSMAQVVGAGEGF